MRDKTPFASIQEKAYQLFLDRKGQFPGNAESDWLQAEIELREVDQEQTGRARASHKVRTQGVTDDDGRDLENPT